MDETAYTTKSPRDRSRVYAFLSALCLYQPNPEFIENSRRVSQALKDFPGMDRVHGFFRENEDKPPEEVTKGLIGSFTRIFRSTSPPVIPPYESIYRGEKLYGESTMSVLKEYRSFGLELDEDFKGEPPDYLGFELDFMRFLCEKEAEAFESGDLRTLQTILEAEIRFLEEHLLTWIHMFHDVVSRFDDGFYQGWIEFIRHWLVQDHRTLARGLKGKILKGSCKDIL